MFQKNFPKELMINDNVWKIKFVRSLKEHDTKTKICLGLCCPDERVIKIRNKQNYQDTLDSIIHEIIHALEFEFEFDLDHDHVHTLGETMAKLFVENF